MNRLLFQLPAVILLMSIPKEMQAQNTSQKDTLSGGSNEEVVVMGSRMRERLLSAPAGVQKASGLYFQNNSAPTPFESLQNLKGVQMITPSMGFQVFNTRGFANTTNVRFAMLVEGMDVQSPHIGSPIGNALGPGSLDIAEVEIVPGVAASLYGMNAINGLANITTISPFDKQGISVQQRTGLSHLGAGNSSARVFSETSLRLAKAWKNKFAIKANFSLLNGYDWVAADGDDMNPDANLSTGLTGESNPANDPVNSYGNESPNRRTMILAGKSYVVARTGYYETDLTAYNLQTIKGDVSVFYKPGKYSTLNYTYRGGLLNNVYQRANRFRLMDFYIGQHSVQYKTPVWQANLYVNSENTGQSYNLRSMAENIDRSYKSDDQWFSGYARGFEQALSNGVPVADAHRQARMQSDAGRPQAGSADFNKVRSRLQQINNWDSGAALRVNAAFVQGDVQWNLAEGLLKRFAAKTAMELMAGADHRTYIIRPDGNYFINPENSKNGQDLLYGKTGAFLSAHRNFSGGRLRLGLAIRADKNDYFPVYFSPRITGVYRLHEKHYLRSSLQAGYRFPVIFEAFSNVNSGGVKRVGGLPVMSEGIFENAWLQHSISNFQAAVIRDVNATGITRNQAISNNKDLLKKNPYTYLQPEHVRSVEMGYRGLFFSNLLFVDADVYFNSYKQFIAQANMSIPNTVFADSIPYALFERSRQSSYRMWTNSSSIVYNYGFSVGLNFRLPKDYRLIANASHAKLTRSNTQDGLEDGFNTPPWMINVTFANQKLTRNLGAGLTWRWQSGFYWQSFLVNGHVSAFGTVDAHVSWRFNQLPVQLKAGGSNIFNQYYNSFLGGPSVGGFYYLNFELEMLAGKKKK